MDTPESSPVLWLAILSFINEATRDGLTGLYNRRFFQETLANHIEAAVRYGRELSLVLFDIDHFKQINDQSGHPAGDKVLKHFADQLRKTARHADIVCRIGGDEFAVLLPETSKTNAAHFVKRVVSKQKFPTVSAGIAALPCDDLMAAADADLMLKKTASRQ